MKITIENFGAIKHFEFDTEKDLTLIFGKNSVGKSYAISLVYLILNSFKEVYLNNYQTIYNSTKEKVESHVGKKLSQLKEENYEIDISEKIQEIIYFLFDIYFLTYLNNSIINTFGNIDNLKNKLNNFDDKYLKITISYQYISIVFCIDDNLNLLKTKSCTLNKSFIFDEKTQYQELYLKGRENFSLICFFNIIEFIYDIITESTLFIYYLPASRSGLYQALSAFGQIFAELSKTRNFISRKVEIPAIPEPIADYFLNLSNIDSSQNINQDFIEYINEIEENILQGKVDFDNQTKKIYFIPDNTELKLDLSSTSSMVSEISPIVSYLKYILKVSDTNKNKQIPVIFIEEPEAHLHPETQVKLMRVFARLVKDNKIKLVMTSHSNYIFNAASNLVMDNKIPADKFEAVLFKMTEEGSVAENMATDEYGIDDDNFIDTAEALYEERIAIINKKNGY